jgi:hypothetical protein
LDDDYPCISGAQPYNPGIGAVLDEVVDDPPLQFERHDLKERDDTRKR